MVFGRIQGEAIGDDCYQLLFLKTFGSCQGVERNTKAERLLVLLLFVQLPNLLLNLLDLSALSGSVIICIVMTTRPAISLSNDLRVVTRIQLLWENRFLMLYH